MLSPWIIRTLTLPPLLASLVPRNFRWYHNTHHYLPQSNESLLCCHFHILVGIFHYRTWLVYSSDGLPQNALGLHEQASSHLVPFVELSYTYSPSASVAWQSLLTHIDIY